MIPTTIVLFKFVISKRKLKVKYQWIKIGGIIDCNSPILIEVSFHLSQTTRTILRITIQICKRGHL